MSIGTTTLVFLCLIVIFYEMIYGVHRNRIEYSLGGRKVGVVGLTATLVMTEFNTATLISFSSLGYVAGLKALILPGVFLIGILFYALAVSKKWKEFNGFSVVDFFSKRYGRDVGFLSALFLFCAMVGFSATYLKSLTLIFASLVPGASYWVISAYLVIITLAMVIRRGLISIIRTDTFAFIVVIILLPWVLYFNWYESSSSGQQNSVILNPGLLDVDFVISLIPLTMFSYILAPWYGQRIFAAKSPKVAFISVILSAIFVFILYSLGVLISYTLATQNISFDDPQNSFPYALTVALEGVFYPGGYIVLFLISSTTLTGVWNAMANILLDFIPETKYKINNTMLINILCAILSYILSNCLVDNILNKMILANIPVVALSFALLAGFYWKKVTKIGVYASIVIGLFVGIASYNYFGEEGIYTYYWGIYGIPLIFLGGIIMSFWSMHRVN